MSEIFLIFLYNVHGILSSSNAKISFPSAEKVIHCNTPWRRKSERKSAIVTFSFFTAVAGVWLTIHYIYSCGDNIALICKQDKFGWGILLYFNEFESDGH